ncbi:hypothetical protein [Desulfovibrio sp. Fe33]|uniref:hypothetical protein n=1 Tax=Desulfovibrio sp. Fe33 TaxID=3020842 RepID=UPI00234D99C6|nr:hypothetical protein [Desulfovibrio sp. Fe33]
MAVHETFDRPELLAHFPDDGAYRWLELTDGRVVYGVSAIADRGGYLELHLTMTRWGPDVRRNLSGDVEWLKSEARRLGLPKIMGVRADDRGRFDKRLFRFARLYGFTDPCVFQTTSLMVD